MNATQLHGPICRCRACKPPLLAVGQRSEALLRVRVGAIGLAMLLAVRLVAGACGL